MPLEDNKVKIYSCGPTVYNYFHIGNARPFIIFDCLRRYFEYRGYDVTFVQNYTDIDDKMINRANEEGITVKELADRFIKEYEIDAKGLGIRPASVHPKATEHIDDIIAFIKTLMEKGYAYEAGGDVYYDTSKNPEYGKLSNKNLMNWNWVRESKWTTAKETPWISYCGKPKRKTNLTGTALGEKAGRDGISNAPLCP